MKLLILISLSVLFCSCSENTRAKSFGGTVTVDLPQNTKLELATWKENQLWYMTRPMRTGEIPETWTFQEKSSLGLIEGKVIFKEK